MSSNGFLKKIELLNRRFLYSVIRFFFSNKPVNQPIEFQKIKKILIFRYDAIGDFVITTPLIDFFKKIIPNCEISVLASNRNKDLSFAHPNVDKTFVYDGSFKSLIYNIKLLRRENYNLIFAGVFFKTTFSGLIANLIGGRNCIKACVGHETRNEQYSTFFNLIVLPAERGTVNMALLQQLIFVKGFGLNEKEAVYKTSIGLDEKINLLVRKKLVPYNGKKIVLYNISARNSWDSDKHIEFLKIFEDKFSDFQLILSATNEDKEKALQIIKNSNSRAVLFNNEYGIMEVCSLINFSDYIISPDTSIPHIATALGKPVIDIYPLIGTTYINEWTPFGDNYKLVTTDGKFSIDKIKPKKVLDAFIELLNEIK